MSCNLDSTNSNPMEKYWLYEQCMLLGNLEMHGLF